ncbi:MAG TPA: hypothetical protein DE276_05270 [Oceanospirillaceae bacterium]|nr:hypothetical protein [Oceanospirillaceae bacterium]
MAGQGGKGGGQPQQPFNVNTAAATGLNNALGATTGLLGGPLEVGAFNNPYQDEVVGTIQDDIERQRQMAMNTIGAQAQSAGAFGGSRQGVLEGTTNAEFGRMAANAIAPIRMRGYDTAVSNAMADRGQRLGAASQLGSLANQAFTTGRTLNQDLMAQGLLQQALQQQLIDNARTDFANYTASPADSLTMPLAALGVVPKPQSTMTTDNPGILGTLGAIKYAFPGMGIFG